MEKYMIISPIGEGSFAKVYRGREKFTGRVCIYLTIELKKNIFFQDVALKFISKLGKTEKDLNFLRREIDILRKMKHENIVEMLNSFETNNEVNQYFYICVDCFFLFSRLLLLRNVVLLIFINY
jgi:fused-like protein